ncbi:MAG TPA: hypothetical protein VMW57_01790 [Methyloceanibacter sp.]|nr:hypothetical protein [Methyloceanibacter sp.]
MVRKLAMFGAGLAALSVTAIALVPAAAKIGESSHAKAIEACSTVNPAQPVKTLGVVDDGSGIGFSLVWLNDAEDRLWMCDADAEGFVYSYSLVYDDLLAGTGPELIGLKPASSGGSDDQPQTFAETICVAYLTDGGTVLSSRADGLNDDPGYAVFVEDQAGGLYLCNATGDAMVWAFEPIGDPLSFENTDAVS